LFQGCRLFTIIVWDKSSQKRLADVTSENVDERVRLLWGIAQRANVPLCIKASIEIGRQKYWSGLATTAGFFGHSLDRYLGAILVDIVGVWNFADPHKLLEAEDFRRKISDVVDDLADRSQSNMPSLIARIGTLGSIAGVVGAVAHPAAPITVPIAAAVLFGLWMHATYQKTPNVLRCMVGYIVDTTIVMESLFWLVQAHGEVAKGRYPDLTTDLIETAVKAFVESEIRMTIHREIREFADGAGVFDRLDSDVTLDRIIALLDKYEFDPEFHRRRLMPSTAA